MLANIYFKWLLSFWGFLVRDLIHQALCHSFSKVYVDMTKCHLLLLVGLASCVIGLIQYLNFFWCIVPCSVECLWTSSRITLIEWSPLPFKYLRSRSYCLWMSLCVYSHYSVFLLRITDFFGFCVLSPAMQWKISYVLSFLGLTSVLTVSICVNKADVLCVTVSIKLVRGLRRHVFLTLHFFNIAFFRCN